MDWIAELVSLISWKELALTSGRIALVVLLIFVLLGVSKALLGRLESRLLERGVAGRESREEVGKRVSTLVRLLRQGVIIFVWVVGLLIVLRDIGVEIGPILASAGIIGLAVGFGAQNLVRDVISGFFIILENQIRVGDVAVVNGTGGLVEQINFRTTVLRDLSGVVHVFPNGTINTLSNMTHEWSAFVFDIGVAYKEDPDEVIAILREVGEEMRHDGYFGPLIIEEIEIFGVDQFADSSVVIKGRLKTRPIRQWEVGREFRRRVKHAFDRRGIEIPFPHRSIYFGDASKPFATRTVQETQGAGQGR
jgi:small conductance mechanosensitive channel